MSCSRLSASFASRFAGGVSSIVGNSANALCSTFLCRSAAPKMVGQSAQQRALHGASTVASIPRGKFGNRMQPTPFGCGLRGGVSLLARPMSAESSGGFQKAPGQNEGEKRNAEEGDDKLPGAKEKMAIVFTCTNCEARVQRIFSKRSYQRGVVIVRVEKEDGCSREDGGDFCLHLIADNLGWFEDQPTNVETLLARRGEAVQRMVVKDSTAATSADGGEAGKGGVKEKVLIKTDTGKTVELFEEEPDEEPLRLK